MRAIERDELLELGILAGTMGSVARLFHVGFVVPSLDAAIASLSDALGVRFAEPIEPKFGALFTPDGSRQVPLRLTYSTRPAHIELIESAPGSLWDFADERRGHHLGVWTDDVAAVDTVAKVFYPAWFGAADPEVWP